MRFPIEMAELAWWMRMRSTRIGVKLIGSSHRLRLQRYLRWQCSARDATILAARALSIRQPFGAFTFVCRHGEVFRGLPVTVDLEGEDSGRPSAPLGWRSMSGG